MEYTTLHGIIYTELYIYILIRELNVNYVDIRL